MNDDLFISTSDFGLNDNLSILNDLPLSPDINDSILPDEMVISAVTRACDFFGLPEVPIVNAQGTCVWPNDGNDYTDDVFGFNREQLMQLGVYGEDSLTLIYTHECAHRTLQGEINDAWEEELACDFFAGVHAGLKNININNFEASLGQTPGGSSHPNGALRTEFIEYGKQIAQEMKDRGVEITFENCLERFNQHLLDREELISEYRFRFDSEYNLANLTNGDAKNATMADVEWYEKQVRNSHGSEQQAWLEKARWARNHLQSLVENEESKGLTSSELSSKISAAEAKIRYAEAEIRRHSELLKNSAYPETEQMHINNAKHDLEKARAELNKWKSTKPSA